MRLRLILLMGGLLISQKAFAQTELINGIAVIVNNAVVTYKEVRDIMAPAAEQVERQNYGQPAVAQQKLQELQKGIIEQLVERELILFDFKTAGYSLPESILEEEIQRRIHAKYGDRLTLTKTLQAEGVTYETFRRSVRDDIIVEALARKNVGAVLLISPQKIEDYYNGNADKYRVGDQVHLRMIVINQTPGMAPGAAKKLAAEIQIKLKEGASFAEMASIYSEGSQRSQGGDWGWVERSVLRKELAEKAFTIPKGQISDVVETPDACYVMMVEDTRAAGVKKLTEVRDEIERTLQGDESARLRKKYIDRLRKKAFVRYF